MSRARQLRRLGRRYPNLRPLQPEDIGYYTVRLEPCGDYPHRDMMYGFVRGEHAERWADAQGYMDGDTWESTGGNEVYVMICNVAHVGESEAGIDPVDRWRAEGYVLDLSDHEDFESSCESCDCKDPKCHYRMHWNRKGDSACGTCMEDGTEALMTEIEGEITCRKCKSMYHEQLTFPLDCGRSFPTRD